LNDSASGKRVLVVAGDTLPLPGLPTTGAGLRAWGLGQGLASCGHAVSYLVPKVGLRRAGALPDLAAHNTIAYNSLDSDELNRQLRELAPDVVVFQHWVAAVNLSEEIRIPVVIDFHGPLLLETLYQDSPHFDGLRQLKVRTLAKADYFTCAGEQQRHYFYPWLLLAGFDVRQDVIGVIPVSMPPDAPQQMPDPGGLTFVYGGVFLPWQDPTVALETLVQVLEERRSGQLRIFGGAHSHIDIPLGKYRDLIPRLAASSRVELMGMVPRDDLVQAYLRSQVAVDLMARNPERELAFTTRTVEYMWCGLPVLYNNYAELSSYIRAYDAGWTVDPLDAGAIRAVFESILDDPAALTRKSENARRLVRERLSWDRTAGPLDAFCRQPYKRNLAQRGHLTVVDALVPLPPAGERPKDEIIAQMRAELRQLRRKPLARGQAWVKEHAKRLLRVDRALNLGGRKVRLGRSLVSGQRIGQVIRADAASLSGVELLVATFGRSNSCDVVLHLQVAADAREEIATARVSALDMRDGAFCSFNFPPVADSADREFYFWVESPDAIFGDCIAPFFDAGDNGLAFRARYG
jgi:glycosyltransferase involved in cell wall biosynthesis